MAAGALLFSYQLRHLAHENPLGAGSSPRGRHSVTIELAECRGRGDRMLCFHLPA